MVTKHKAFHGKGAQWISVDWVRWRERLCMWEGWGDGEGVGCKVMVSRGIWWCALWAQLNVFGYLLYSIAFRDNTLLPLVFFSRVQCQQRYFYDYCLGYNKLCFTRDVRIFFTIKQKSSYLNGQNFQNFSALGITWRPTIAGFIGSHLSITKSIFLEVSSCSLLRPIWSSIRSQRAAPLPLWA